VASLKKLRTLCDRIASGKCAMIAELEAAFLRACPSFDTRLQALRADHAFTGDELTLAAVLDHLGYHLGNTAEPVRGGELLQVMKVAERVLVDGSEQQKWAVTHFLLPGLQRALRERGHPTDILLPHLGSVTASWWNDLTKNPPAVENWDDDET
jgi:hypothetical protein